MVSHLSMTKPDDWHVHCRDGDMLKHTVAASAHHFARALIMPNLKPPLTTIPNLLDYRQRIIDAIPKHLHFVPYVTLYLNESVAPETLISVKKHTFILGAKLYPAGATTHAEAGARSIQSLYPLFDLMQSQDLVLQIHGEMNTGDIFEREAAFIEVYLKDIIRNFPRLRVVLEHISTTEAVDFITHAPETIGATITPHHLRYDRNHLLAGGIKPHYYCLPVLKHAKHQKALLKAATSGDPHFFAGTDSAPHARNLKENACGCAGIYSAPFAVSLYASAFEEVNKLHQLEGFMSHFGADFYQLPRSKSRIELRKQSHRVPKTLALGKQRVVPMASGELLDWSIHE